MKRTVPSLYFFVTVLLSAAFTVLRTCMLLGGYDYENGFYTNNTQHALLGGGLLVCAALFFVCGYIYNKKEENKPAALPQTSVTNVTAFIAGAALVGYVLYSFTMFAVFTSIDIAAVFLGIFALIGSFYYFTERQYKGKNADFRALLCASVAFSLLVLVFDLYFDKTVSFANHSVKLAFAAAIFLMLTLLSEANFSLRRPEAWRRYFCYAPTAILLSMTLAVPDLIAAAAYRTAVISDLYYDILIFTIGLHQAARLGAVAFAKEN